MDEVPIPNDFSPEFSFITSRSSGPGGQNVNKVSSKVELRFHVASSRLLTDEQKHILEDKCKTVLTADGFLRFVSQAERSQLKNKNRCIEKFYALLEKCFRKKKKRKPAKPSAEAKQKRLDKKKRISEKKTERKRIYL